MVCSAIFEVLPVRARNLNAVREERVEWADAYMYCSVRGCCLLYDG